MKIIFDLDGTLANLSHRLRFLDLRPKDYSAFHAACVDDTCIYAACDLLRMYWLADDSVVILTCRPDTELVRDITKKWLRAQGLNYDKLLMRPDGDHRPDAKVKLEMLGHLRATDWNPDLVLEDRTSVVEMWRAEGIPCWQVAPGDF